MNNISLDYVYISSINNFIKITKNGQNLQSLSEYFQISDLDLNNVYIGDILSGSLINILVNKNLNLKNILLNSVYPKSLL